MEFDRAILFPSLELLFGIVEETKNSLSGVSLRQTEEAQVF